MKNKRGYQSTALSTNRKMVRASASVTKGKNSIHFMSEVDISLPRRIINEYFEKTGERLSFTAYIVTCLAHLMDKYPHFNSFIKGNKLVLLDDVTISVLLERDITGEKVPEPIGIKQAQSKSYREIHDEIRTAQAQQADALGSLSGISWIRFIPGFLLKTFVRLADRNIKMAKMYGKIAVTAVGMFSANPLWVIPHGSATVLISVGSISQKVIYVDNKPESREHLCLTASFDHNIIDGAPASQFMNELIESIKNAELLSKTINS